MFGRQLGCWFLVLTASALSLKVMAVDIPIALGRTIVCVGSDSHRLSHFTVGPFALALEIVVIVLSTICLLRLRKR